MYFTEFPDQASTFAGEIDWVINYIHALVGVWFILAEAILLFFLIYYRHRQGVERKIPYVPANGIKGAWVVLSITGLVVLCDFSVEILTAPTWHKIKEHMPAPGTDFEYDELVRIKGRQFFWQITYAGKDGFLDTADDIETTELHVPIDKVVRFQMESGDVLHCFHVPEFRLKQDAVPGRSIPGWFIANKEGTYVLACAELCGVNHTSMKTKLVVENEQSFNEWLQTQK